MERNSPIWFDKVEEKQRFPQVAQNESCDIAVIGGGMCGILTAFVLAKRGKKVILVEKGKIASGDTSFTTGFLTRVPDAECSELEKKYGKEFLSQVFTASKRAQTFLKNLIHDEKIDCDFSECNSHYCTYSKDDGKIPIEWQSIKDAGADAELLEKENAPKIASHLERAILFKGEAKFDPRKFIFSLLGRQRENLTVFEHSEASELKVGGNCEITVNGFTVTAETLIVAIGNPLQLFPEFEKALKQKVTFVIVAKFNEPLQVSNNLFWDTFQPYYYYRLIDDSTIMLGGQDRVLGEANDGKNPFDGLKKFLDDNIGKNYLITSKWSGSLYETADGLPYIAVHPLYKNKVFIGTGFNGNGLVFGALAANILSDFAMGLKNEFAKLFSFERTKLSLTKKEVATIKFADFTKVAKAAQLKEGRAVCVSIDGKKIALYKSNGKIFALENTCSHQGGSLCDGEWNEKEVQCPMHGAKFNIETGAALQGPAEKPVKTFDARIQGDEVEIKLKQTNSPNSSQTAGYAPPKPFQELWTKTNYILTAGILASTFWVLQFLYQYYVVTPGQLERSLVRSFAFAGATLIGIALLIGPIARLFPKVNFITHRRTLGVWGFLFIIIHSFFVYLLIYNFDFTLIFYSLNPFENPILFGMMAYWLFLPLALTSMDWAVAKLGKHWKTLHRLAYPAFILAVCHFTLMNPALFDSISKGTLVIISGLVLALEIIATIKTLLKTRKLTATIYFAFLLITGGLLIFLALSGFRG